MKSLIAIAVSMSVVFGVQAQLGKVVVVDLVSQQAEYLPNEELLIGVRIANKSGRTLHFGRDNSWVRFDVQSLDGRNVGVMADLPVAGEFKIESPMRAVRRFDIAPYFEMNQSGRYFVTATVEVREPGWNQILTSRPLTVDIVKGTTVWDQDFGVVGAPGTQPEIRQYALQKANLMDNRMKMYLRVTSLENGKVFKVTPIDYIMSFSRKEARLDRYNNLHILLQTPRGIARDYNYSVYGADGRLILRQTYNSNSERPKLVTSGDGLVKVKGGERRIARSDVPQIDRKSKPAKKEGEEGRSLSQAKGKVIEPPSLAPVGGK